MKFSKITLSASLLLFTLMYAGCFSPPAFPGGVRVRSVEALANVGNSEMPVPGVLDYGNASSSGSNNGQTSFEGVTGSYGIDDHPNAAVDTTWSITTNWNVTVYQCGSASTTGYVPTAGASFTSTCYMY